MSKRKEKMVEFVKIENAVQEIYKKLMNLELDGKEREKEYTEELDFLIFIKKLERKKFYEMDIEYIKRTIEEYGTSTLKYIVNEIANLDSFSNADEAEDNYIYKRINNMIGQDQYEDLARKKEENSLLDYIKKEIEKMVLEQAKSKYEELLGDLNSLEVQFRIDPATVQDSLNYCLKEIVRFYIQKEKAYLLLKNIEEAIQKEESSYIKKELIIEKYQYIFRFCYIEDYLFTKTPRESKTYLINNYDKRLVNTLYEVELEEVINRCINAMVAITDQSFEENYDEAMVNLILNGIDLKTSIEIGGEDHLDNIYYKFYLYITSNDLKDSQTAINYIKNLLNKMIENSNKEPSYQKVNKK